MALVIYTGASDEQIRWGTCDDPRGLLIGGEACDDPRGLLIEGEAYVLEDVEIYHFHTKFMLKGFPDKKFNSLCFLKPTPSNSSVFCPQLGESYE